MKTKPLIIVFFAALFVSSAFGDAWNDSDIFIESVFRQTDDTGSFSDPTHPFALRASARNTFSDQQQTLALPVGSSYTPNPATAFQRIGAHHVFRQGSASFSGLTTLFPSGNYTWAISGSNSNGSVEPTISVSSTAPPSFQPQIVNGTWHNGRLRLLASDPRFQIAPWSSAPTGSRIEFELWRYGGAGGSSMGASTTEVSWLPQPVGSIFSAYLSFRVIENEGQVDTPDGIPFNSRSGQSVTLYFEIEMVESLGPVEEVPTVSILQAIKLQWISQSSKTYQVQFSDDMETWENVGAVIQGTGQEVHFFDSASSPRKFYRAVVTPGVASNLVILEALYGADDTFSDVRSYAEQNVVDDTVDMTVGNHTLGGDPIFGVSKELYIRYQNASGEYEATIQEGDSLRIPDSNHTQL
jgi:hypothetical protein